MNLTSFAIPKNFVNPKVTYDPWGNAYKPNGIPKSKSQKATRPTQKPKNLVISKREVGLGAQKVISTSEATKL